MRPIATAAVLAGLMFTGALLPSGATALDGGSPSLTGTTGLLNTPTAEVTPDAAFRIGFFSIDKEWAYEGRGHHPNDVYFFTAGFLPNLEVMIRATVIPGTSLLEEVRVPAADRMGSARLLVLRERRWPAVAVGLDDVKGTGRFRSLYAVASKSVRPSGVPFDLEVSGGYGAHKIRISDLEVNEAARYVLDGGFGGLEARGWKSVSGMVEYDSEKWNAGFRLVLFKRLAGQAAFLNMETLSGGASWTQRF